MPEHANCPFCPGMMKTREGIVDEGEHWIVFHNARGYLNTKVHLLIIPKRHVTMADDLTPDEIVERAQMVAYCRANFGQGINFCRHGDEGHTGSTVLHMHWHYIVAEPGKTVLIHCGPDSSLSKGPPQA